MNHKIDRVLQTKTLQACIELVLKLLVEVAKAGLFCKPNDGRKLLLHLVNALYVANIPKSEDILSVRKDNSNKHAMSLMRGKERKVCCLHNGRNRKFFKNHTATKR